MDEARLKRIAFRAWRRGFREADLILGPFSDRYCPDMTSDDLDLFEQLLSENDHDLYDWISGRRPAPEALNTPILRALQDFQRSLPVAGGDLSGS